MIIMGRSLSLFSWKIGHYWGSIVMVIGDLFQFLGPHFCSKFPIFSIKGLRTCEKSMQPLHNINHVITCNNTTSTCDSHARLTVLEKNNYSSLIKAYFIELACFAQFCKRTLYGSPYCWRGSPFGPHFTEIWVPIGSPF